LLRRETRRDEVMFVQDRRSIRRRVVGVLAGVIFTIMVQAAPSAAAACCTIPPPPPCETHPEMCA
jgi:hypothetical protein